MLAMEAGTAVVAAMVALVEVAMEWAAAAAVVMAAVVMAAEVVEVVMATAAAVVARAAAMATVVEGIVRQDRIGKRAVAHLRANRVHCVRRVIISGAGPQCSVRAGCPPFLLQRVRGLEPYSPCNRSRKDNPDWRILSPSRRRRTRCRCYIYTCWYIHHRKNHRC